jgi:hypothetical protein
VIVQDSPVGLLHEYEYSTGFGSELDWCFFNMGMTTSAPPEFEEYWQDNLIEPSDEELEEMDENAEGLLVDCGLV